MLQPSLILQSSPDSRIPASLVKLQIGDFSLLLLPQVQQFTRQTAPPAVQQNKAPLSNKRIKPLLLKCTDSSFTIKNHLLLGQVVL